MASNAMQNLSFFLPSRRSIGPEESLAVVLMMTLHLAGS